MFEILTPGKGHFGRSPRVEVSSFQNSNNSKNSFPTKEGSSEKIHGRFNADVGPTELGYGTTPNGCRGGSRFVKGGFKKLTEIRQIRPLIFLDK